MELEIERARLVDRGSITFLQQAHRNNWQRYLASLPTHRGSLAPEDVWVDAGNGGQGWDLCILTASDERQAAMYRQQLAWRRPVGLLPAATRFLVVPDPAGQRLGSGGATLRVLAQLLAGKLAKEPCIDPPGLQVKPEFPDAPPQPNRVLLIHSGGDSKRLPHCSATGKLFARVPRLLPDGRASTVFDEFLIGLSGLASELPPGVLVASGDVLLIFDHLQLAFQRGGVIGVAAAAPAAMGLHHGVYISAADSHRVRAYLHKPPATELAHWDGVDRDGTVQIDTGLVWWDQAAVNKLVALAQEPAIINLLGPLATREDETALASFQARSSSGLNLYGDLLLPLAQSTTLPDYLADTSDGPIVPGLAEARRAIWNTLRGTPFSVVRLQPAVFVHFGTSAEYWHMAAADAELAQLCSWDQQAAAWIAPAAPAGTATEQPDRLSGLVVANAAVEGTITLGSQPVLVIDSYLRGPLSCEGAAVIAGVHACGTIRLLDGTVLHQLPVRPLGKGGSNGFVTQVFGLQDNPKQAWNDAAASFLNRPWHSWLAAIEIDPEIIWPGMQPGERTLWNARLFPVTAEREEGLQLALPLQASELVPAGWAGAWTAASRISMAESAALADGDRLSAELAATEDHIVARRFFAAIEAEEPAALAAQWFKQPAGDLLRRSQEIAGWLTGGGSWLQVRGYRALAEATGDRRWEDRAFEVLAESIRAALPASPYPRHDQAARRNRHLDAARGTTMRVQAAARVDFGGGWTDTPPYSIERGGTVLNAAVRLRGIYPVFCEASWLGEPRIILESRDLDTVLEPACAGEILAYANPADPFALCKAALVLRGIVPADSPPGLKIDDLCRGLGGGLRLSTGTTIPRGSGLGTSSIMAGAVLTSLNRLLQSQDQTKQDSPSRWDTEAGMTCDSSLFAEVLVLEQMLTTGGGWQDQVGGLVGGVKLLTTAPGLPQQINIKPVRLPAQIQAELAARLLLVYTGQQRLAKNLLHAIMSRWMARERKMVWILDDLARLAYAMHQALAAGDVTGFGALMGEHWILNKRMDPGCTNPFIDQLFTLMEPYIAGAKLAGAGGGGFAIVVARDAEASRRLPAILEDHLPGTPVAVWPCAVPAMGMTVDET